MRNLNVIMPGEAFEEVPSVIVSAGRNEITILRGPNDILLITQFFEGDEVVVAQIKPDTPDNLQEAKN